MIAPPESAAPGSSASVQGLGGILNPSVRLSAFLATPPGRMSNGFRANSGHAQKPWAGSSTWRHGGPVSPGAFWVFVSLGRCRGGRPAAPVSSCGSRVDQTGEGRARRCRWRRFPGGGPVNSRYEE